MMEYDMRERRRSQVWQCTDCETGQFIRIPREEAEPGNTVRIGCMVCHDITEHEFVRIA